MRRQQASDQSQIWLGRWNYHNRNFTTMINMLRAPMYKGDNMQDEISNISKHTDGETKQEQAEMTDV